MSVFDSDVFGGATPTPWRNDRAVAQYQVVISPLNGQLYRSTVGGITAVDPALDFDKYTQVDTSDPIGSMRQFSLYQGSNPIIKVDGKTYLASGSVADASLYPTVPKKMWSLGDVWVTNTTQTYIGVQANTATNSVVSNGTNGIWLAIDTQGSIYRSSDDAYSWIRLGYGPAAAANGSARLTVDPSGIFYLANSAGVVYKSTDNGTTWNAVTKPSADNNLAAEFKWVKNTLWWTPYTSTNTTTYGYYSTNNGATWTAAQVSGSIPSLGYITSVEFADTDTIVILCRQGQSYNHYLVISNDSGATWTSYTFTLNATSLPLGLLWDGSNFFFNNAVYDSTSNSYVVTSRMFGKTTSPLLSVNTTLSGLVQNASNYNVNIFFTGTHYISALNFIRVIEDLTLPARNIRVALPAGSPSNGPYTSGNSGVLGVPGFGPLGFSLDKSKLAYFAYYNNGSNTNVAARSNYAVGISLKTSLATGLTTYMRVA